MRRRVWVTCPQRGDLADLDRALIQEHVRTGHRNARAKGKRLVRPATRVDASRIITMRDCGLSWRATSGKLGIGVATVDRLGVEHEKGRNV